MRDFTLSAYKALLSALEYRGYEFCTFEQLTGSTSSRVVVLRHDVDKNPGRALQMATLENHLSVRASYHIRVLQGKAQKTADTVKKLVDLGHEIGYHYEDLSRAYRDKKLFNDGRAKKPGKEKYIEKAKKSFNDNLDFLRQYYPVKVISMHGDPGSSIDNRSLWDHLNYREMGVICEPYLDIDYNKVLYITDTGRRWNAGASNIRDRVYKDDCGNRYLKDLSQSSRTTFDVINRVGAGSFPDTVIINTHPQRWINDIMPWLSELLFQNFKNFIKSSFINKKKLSRK